MNGEKRWPTRKKSRETRGRKELINWIIGEVAWSVGLPSWPFILHLSIHPSPVPFGYFNIIDHIHSDSVDCSIQGSWTIYTCI